MKYETLRRVQFILDFLGIVVGCFIGIPVALFGILVFKCIYSIIPLFFMFCAIIAGFLDEPIYNAGASHGKEES